MCTAISANLGGHFFGRTLDFERGFGEKVVIAPPRFPLKSRHNGTLFSHPLIMGMACVVEGVPLFFDAVNESGLAMAGLNFEGFSHYPEYSTKEGEVASFDFISFVLARAKNLNEAKKILHGVTIVNTPFSDTLSPSPLHFIIADKSGAITVESTKKGLKIYNNPVGVLTNNPPFPYHMTKLSEYMGVGAKEGENRFSKRLPLTPFSRGMGAIGLPGDLSSTSRFTRACFFKENSPSPKTKSDKVGQFFHILSSVEQIKGGVILRGNKLEYTRYTSCIDTKNKVYYYTTYSNRRINAVRLKDAYLDETKLLTFDLVEKEDINYVN